MTRKVLHIPEDFSAMNTGVTTAIKELTSNVRADDLRHCILAPDNSPVQVAGDVAVEKYRECAVGRGWRWSPEFSPALRRLTTQECIYHVHGLWMAPQIIAARNAVRQEVPAILSPHNMFSRWQWHRKWLHAAKKRLYWDLVASPAFRKIEIVHALTVVEREEISSFFPRKRIEIIPNALDVASIDVSIAALDEINIEADKYMLFLGRLHPIKGLEVLIDSLASLPDTRRMRLVIAGPPTSANYLRYLERKVSDLNLSRYVHFVGAVSGRDKWKLLRGAWVLVAPSYSEGMSMTVLEAMACSTPVVTTRGAGIDDVPEGGGILTSPAVGKIAQALTESGSWSFAERLSRGNAARHLLERRYSWNVVAPQYLSLYDEAAR